MLIEITEEERRTLHHLALRAVKQKQFELSKPLTRYRLQSSKDKEIARLTVVRDYYKALAAKLADPV